jgi:hypothetical protein
LRADQFEPDGAQFRNCPVIPARTYDRPSFDQIGFAAETTPSGLRASQIGFAAIRFGGMHRPKLPKLENHP